MSTKKVAQSRAEEKPKPEEQPRAQAIPLADVSFTVQRQPHFAGEEGIQQVTIPGYHVATLLDCFIQKYPTGDVKLFTDPASIGLQLAALSETCRALSDSDWGEHDASQAFYGLHRILEDLSPRLTAGDEVGWAEKATVTIQQLAAAA